MPRRGRAGGRPARGGHRRTGTLRSEDRKTRRSSERGQRENGGTVRGSELGDMSQCRVADAREVARREVDIVEQVRYEAFGYRNRVAIRFPGGDRTAGCRIGNERRFAAGLFHREARDFLRLAFVQELETSVVLIF